MPVSNGMNARTCTRNKQSFHIDKQLFKVTMGRYLRKFTGFSGVKQDNGKIALKSWSLFTRGWECFVSTAVQSMFESNWLIVETTLVAFWQRISHNQNVISIPG